MDAIPAPLLNAARLPWFNVEKPLDLPDLRGKLAILDFWTFCCINCIHIIPTLKRIEARFPETVAVIGVHSPKFPGEKVAENLRQAIARYEICHPVVHDLEFTIWRRYTVNAWPTLVFIGPDGSFLGRIEGEPEAGNLEATIDRLLTDYKKTGRLSNSALPLLVPPESPAVLRFPGKLAYNPEDKTFAVADSNHNQIAIADRAGRIVQRIGSGAAGARNGSFQTAEFFRPQGLCYGGGALWVADTENHLLRKIDLAQEQVSTAAGTGKPGGPLWEGERHAAGCAVSSPWDAAWCDGRLYFANAGTHQIGVLRAGKNTVALFAGTGREALIDGPRRQSAFAQPSGLSIGGGRSAAGGRLFLADSETSAVRGIGLDAEGHVETYVGTGLFDFGDKDGVGREARLQHPLGVHYANGKVLIADSYNNKIRILDPQTRAVTTVVADLVCDDRSCTRLWEPAGVIEVDKLLYVADTNNHRILKIDPRDGKTAVFI